MDGAGSASPSAVAGEGRGASAIRRTFRTMGTVASLRVDPGTRGCLRDPAPALLGVFDRYEAEFSRWDDATPASAIADGRMRLRDASELHRDAYARAVGWRNRLGGAFDPHRPDGTIDLAGIVKALAIEEAGAVLDGLGADGWCLNVGGDVLTGGVTAAGNPWRAGIVDPLDRTRLLGAVELQPDRRAVATSGIAERGAHIWGSDASLVQASVLAGDIVTADVLATAVMAEGESAAEQVRAEFGVAVITVRADGSTRSFAEFSSPRVA